MTKFNWNPEADALLTWVAGGVWCHEKRARKGKHMIDHVYLFERVADFLDALNEFQPFEKSRKILNAQTVDRRAKKLQWEKPQWVKRPSCLSEDILKGQFGEVGLKDLHKSTLNLRCVLGNNTPECSKQGISSARRKSCAEAGNGPDQRISGGGRRNSCPEAGKGSDKKTSGRRRRRSLDGKISGRGKKRREQQPRRGVERLGYTKDTEYSGGLSWTDSNASSSHYPEPGFNSHGGAFRNGAKDVYFNPPLFPSIDNNFDGSKTGSRNER
ncbi:uncharacterized protein EAE97_009988 [Botrytis byssoidea]|uniref:Uncharacterized protein n=1 Tax=Botrytis byssoidea TaxID=139641 RepID=A0A9P5HYS6_9HELO|nr:uncharacterized protein EAE97_009988 [Botrytis byssoidea]KAF7927313.1 hypothetical protein EAE97_009988 [Botrytis byssoidea]